MMWSQERKNGALSIPSTPRTLKHQQIRISTCPSCGHLVHLQDQPKIEDLPGLPAGVKFDPTDQEILEHLEAKAGFEGFKLHPMMDRFIPTLEGENGICYTHPEKLPGVTKGGLIRHFFHRPSKAYTTGTRKRRKVHTEEDGGETRWHKTGKTRPITVTGYVRGFKKILVLYTNYGRQRKPEKTNWVMHQYHLGNNEEEREGELVLSKVFYQTQPRQCGSGNRDPDGHDRTTTHRLEPDHCVTGYFGVSEMVSCAEKGIPMESPQEFIRNFQTHHHRGGPSPAR